MPPHGGSVSFCSATNSRSAGSAVEPSGPASTAIAPWLVLDDRVEDPPRRECRDAFPRQRQLPLQALQHGRVQVADRIVALDRVVVRFAEENLRVARIRKPLRVGEAHAAFQSVIPRDRAVRAIQVPQKNGIIFLRRSSGVSAQNRL